MLNTWVSFYSLLEDIIMLQTDGWYDRQFALENAGFIASSRLFALIVIWSLNFVFTNLFVAVILRNIEKATSEYEVSGSQWLKGHSFMTSTRREEGVRLRWAHVDGRSQAPCGRPHRKLKIESTDVILSSSHAKLVSFLNQNFVFRRNKKWKIFDNIN